MGNKKLIFSIIGGVSLYLVSALVSYAGFNYLNNKEEPVMISPLETEKGEGGFRVNLNAPRTEECPLNGGMFSKDERKIWEERRPLTVMIENHLDSRPQSGLSRADIIYEAVAEGGITRFLAVFYCGAVAEEVTIGPVRSARTYFLDFASEYGDYPLYAHVGGANVAGPANALGQIADYGWLKKGNDLNQFAIGFPVFWRDYERIGHPVATEHTMYSTTEKLWEVAHKRGLDAKDKEGNSWNKNFVSWKFKNEARLEERGTVNKIEFDFWKDYKDYSVRWEYDREKNLYYRFNGGVAHKDLNNQEQLSAKTVIIQFMEEKGPIDDLKHLLYKTVGKGKAIVFRDGLTIQGWWEKSSRQGRTKFFDSKRKEIELNRGQIWIEILPAGREISF